MRGGAGLGGEVGQDIFSSTLTTSDFLVVVVFVLVALVWADQVCL